VNANPNERPEASRRTEPALFACALGMAVVLGVLLAPILQQPARAEMVSESAHLVAMTARGGNEEILLVLDNRAEQLAVYKVLNQNSVQMLQQVDLPSLFEAARVKRLGRE
jgi:hypothetical protein